MSNEQVENGQIPSQTQDTKSKSNRKEKWKFYLSIGLMIFFDIILPFILYYILKNHIKELWALVISGIPPFIIAIYGLISKRRVEILGVVIIISFIVSALVTLIRNDPRIQLLRKSSITGSLGLIFIITLIPIKIRTFEMRPASFYLFKDMAMGGTFGLSSSSINLPGLTEDEPISERWDRYWNSYPSFRRTFIVLTAVWGCGFLSEVPIRTVIVFITSTEQAFLWTNVINYTWIAVLALFTLLYSSRMKKQAEKSEYSDLNKIPE